MPAGPRRKPQADLYTVLLVIALLAVLIGILFLYLEMDLYKFELKGGPSVGMMIDPLPAVSDWQFAWCIAPGIPGRDTSLQFPSLNPQSLGEHGCSLCKVS
jgi:hypothetical protein